MTRDRGIEPVLDRWFSEGPTRMPDAFFDLVANRLERVPQRQSARFRSWLPTRRLHRGHAAAAAIIVAVAAGGSLLTRDPGLGNEPSPTPSVTPTPSFRPESVPLALRSSWSSVGTRGVPVGDGFSPNRYDIRIDPSSINIPDLKADVLSSASLVAPDRLQLHVRTTSIYWECHVDDQGEYTFRLSLDGQTLTLTAVGDACDVRAGILAGDWIRTDIGDLAPGAHTSALFRPFGATTGQFSYTVPTGWIDTWECAGCFALSTPGSDGPGIQLLSNVAPSSQDAACKPIGAGVGPTPADIADWLAALPGLVVAGRRPVTVGGLNGVSVDLSIAKGWLNKCSYSQSGVGDQLGPPVYDSPRDLFANPDGSPALGLVSDDRARYIILDGGDGRIVVIDLESTGTAPWDRIVKDAMPIIDSFRFTR